MRAAVADWFAAEPAPALLGLSLLREEFASLQSTDQPADPALSTLLLLMTPDLLGAAVRAEPNIGWRREFLLLMIERLSPLASVHLVTASTAFEHGPFPSELRVLLETLARRCAEPGSQVESVSELRDVLATHIGSIGAERTHSVARGFEQLYDNRVERRSAGRTTPEPERLLQLAIEVGVAGRTTWIAWSELVEAGRSRDLIDLLKIAPEQNAATAALAARFATVRGLGELLQETPVDFAAVDVIVRQMGANAGPALVEALAESRSRTTRNGLFERLSQLGPGVASAAELRLRDSRWFVIRNMLALLRACRSEGSSAHADRFLAHEDARVRREAVLLLMSDARARDRAIAAGLKDADRQVLQAVMNEARGNLPDIAVPVLAKRLSTGDLPPELRVKAIHLLGRKSSALALEALLRHAQSGRTLLGKPRLAARSPEMLAAISGLARTWRHDRRARALLDVAARSRDADVAKAAAAAVKT